MLPYFHGIDSRAEMELKLAHVMYRETVQSVSWCAEALFICSFWISAASQSLPEGIQLVKSAGRLGGPAHDDLVS